tara:strand:- start:286 stop:537 length:252 start_codon:yes stop_codon:yes gene_type:complete
LDFNTGEVMKAFEFTFTVRTFGSTPDEAFQALQEELEDGLCPLFKGFVDYEEVSKEETDKEVQELMLSYAEESILESLDIGEA